MNAWTYWDRPVKITDGQIAVIAEECGVDESTVQRWYSGVEPTPPQALPVAVVALGASLGAGELLCRSALGEALYYPEEMQVRLLKWPLLTSFGPDKYPKYVADAAGNIIWANGHLRAALPFLPDVRPEAPVSMADVLGDPAAPEHFGGWHAWAGAWIGDLWDAYLAHPNHHGRREQVLRVARHERLREVWALREEMRSKRRERHTAQAASGVVLDEPDRRVLLWPGRGAVEVAVMATYCQRGSGLGGSEWPADYTGRPWEPRMQTVCWMEVAAVNLDNE